MADDDTQGAAPAQADTASPSAVPDQQITAPTETAPAQADTAGTETTERLWANKYKAPEVMEEAHLDLQRRFTMEAQRRAELERQVGTGSKPADATPKYTTEQIEGAKIDLLDKMADARLQGDAAKAREYASQIVWCDRELMTQRMAGVQTQARAESAERTMMQEMSGVVQRYANELQPGTPMYEKAASLLDGYVAMGMANNAITQAHAVVMAAQLLGKTQGGVEQTTRRELTKTINQALKSGVVAGAGHANATAPTTPDFMNMPKADFDAWTRANVR